ncbi:MAG: hypothetical protein WC841_05015 [Candidatus Shapirobacteria bacterium]|jgi:hypothetical protein
MTTEQEIFLAFAITLVTELTLILAIQRPGDWQKWIAGILLINCFTHPIVIYLLHFQNWPYLLVEAGVILTEAVWYRKFFSISPRRAMLVSFVANIFSIFMGMVARKWVEFMT